ncbi:hypothetical protein ACTA71_007391 [Dictyostelium dimigraforme]
MESETPENISKIIRKELRIERCSSSIRTKIKNIKNSATANPATANPVTVNPATANPARVENHRMTVELPPESARFKYCKNSIQRYEEGKYIIFNIIKELIDEFQ